MNAALRPVRPPLLRAVLVVSGLLGPLAVCLAQPAPAPLPLTSAAIVCHSDGDCPPNLLCCPEFGYFGSPKICKTPVNGHCPLIP